MERESSADELTNMKGTVLARFLRNNPYTTGIFQGVYPVDRLPLSVRYPCAIVINTDTASGEGEHWTAVYIDGFQKGVYFDSMGLPPLDPRVLVFLNTHAVKWLANPLTIQSVVSDKCGHYCLYFVYKQTRGASLRSLLRPFDALRLWRNDVWVIRWYNRHKPILFADYNNNKRHGGVLLRARR